MSTISTSGHFLAVDWGTTNRRIFEISDGVVISSHRDDLGISAVPREDFVGHVQLIHQDFGDLPILMAGMIGSNRGLLDAGYVPAPARLDDLALGLVRAGENVWIVPGVSFVEDGRSDVMRGEEVQLLGAACSGMAPPDALLCQPGTHCKWARLQGGSIASFATAMTGELFALLGTHSLLASQLAGKAMPGPSFLAGVHKALEGNLLRDLFGIRATSVLSSDTQSDFASYASGLLIGTDCLANAHGDEVHLLADAFLGDLYSWALDALGIRALRVDSHAAFVAGIQRIWELAN